MINPEVNKTLGKGVKFNGYGRECLSPMSEVGKEDIVLIPERCHFTVVAELVKRGIEVKKYDTMSVCGTSLEQSRISVIPDIL